MDFEIADPRVAYDVVYLSSQADISRWADYDKGAVIFELIDSYLALPRYGPKQLMRGMAKFATRDFKRPVWSHRRALERMIERSDAVVCSTEEQKAALTPLCPNAHIILDVHDEYSGTKTTYARGDQLNLVWEGFGENATAFRPLLPVLMRVNEKVPIALHLVTDVSYKRYMNRFGARETAAELGPLRSISRVYQWDAQRAPQIITSCDIAVIPLTLNDPFKVGKPANKLFIFWKMGMPAITSASPAYVRAMEAAGLDLACETEAEWEQALTRLAFDEAARREAGSLGKSYVESVHSTAHVLDAWDRLFDSVRG
jgi:hypothetical protein